MYSQSTYFKLTALLVDIGHLKTLLDLKVTAFGQMHYSKPSP